MAPKNNNLSITLSAIDHASGPIRALNARIASLTAPIRAIGAKLPGLASAAGFPKLIDGFKGVGSAITGLLAKVGLIGGVVGAAVVGLFSIADSFDELGDKAESMGVSVDFLSQMRYAAEQSGASIEQLDAGLQGFSTSLGLARAGTGKMAGFLKQVSPELLKQVTAAKSNAEAFDLLAAAMDKLEDPAKRSAFAQKTLGSAELAPLLDKGAKGIKELRDEHFGLAKSQEAAAAAAGKLDVAKKRLGAAVDGVKAKLVEGLGPALEKIVDQLTKWFVDHQEDIAKWAADIGEKLPAAVQKIVEWIGKAYDKVVAFVDKVGGLKNVAIAAGLILAGPLISAVVSLGSALVTTAGAMSGLVKSAAGLGGVTGKVGTLAGAVGGVALPIAGAMAINELTGGSFEDQARAKGFKGKDGDLFGSMKHLYDTSRARPGTSDVIKGIADRGKAIGARAAANDVLSRNDAFTAQALAKADLRPSVERATAKPGSSSSAPEARISVDFTNVPRGVRVNADPTNTVDVDLSVGHQMTPSF